MAVTDSCKKYHQVKYGVYINITWISLQCISICYILCSIMPAAFSYIHYTVHRWRYDLIYFYSDFSPCFFYLSYFFMLAWIHKKPTDPNKNFCWFSSNFNSNNLSLLSQRHKISFFSFLCRGWDVFMEKTYFIFSEPRCIFMRMISQWRPQAVVVG